MAFDFTPLAARRTAARGGALAGPCQIQFHRRQQRCGRSAGRRPDRGGDGLAQARGAQSRDLQSGARPARLPPAARVPRDQAQARRRDCVQRRRHPDAVRLLAGARSGQRRAADARRYRDLREGQLPEHADALRAARSDGDRHSARQGRHAHGCARRCPRRLQGARRAAEDDLHHPDGAEPDRDDHARGAARRAAAALRAVRRRGVRGRLLFRPDLERPAPARALRDEQGAERDPHRLVLEVDRARAARRFPGRAVADPVAHPAAQDGCGVRRGRADAARRILRAAFRDASARAAQGAAQEGRDADGNAERAVRHGGRVRGPEGRHLPVGEAARQRRYDEALSGGAEGGRRDQSRQRVVDRQGAQLVAPAAVLREPDA